jgi:hypothetical protein
MLRGALMETGTDSPPAEDTIEVEPVEEVKDYDLHIKVPSEMRQTLRNAAELAYEMEDISKPDLVDLMNLYIKWGMEVQKKKWLDRIGYR